VLLQLNVKDFALIEDLQLTFKPGLNVLSGETGAGKSIIIGAIGLILGERASAEHVREGTQEAYIEAIFDWSRGFPSHMRELLKEGGLDPEENLVISREVIKEGRSIGRVNGRAVPISFLKELGAGLIDLHGQHQHQSLLDPEQHLEMLDAYGGDKVAEARQKVAALYKKRKQCLEQLDQLGKDDRERERRKEILSYQIDEIDQSSLSPEEEEELLHKQKLLSHAEKLYHSVSLAYHYLAGEGGAPGEIAVRDRLSEILKEAEEASSIDTSLHNVVQMIQGGVAQLEEAARELGHYRGQISFDPGELEQVQERLEKIKNLKKKYGDSVEEVLQFAQQCREELEKLEQSEETALRLEKELKEVEQDLESACRHLSDVRWEMAAALEEALVQSLGELALEKARISITLESEKAYTSRGWDRVEFMFSANPGESLKPLSKIISGGEMSRVMLSLKSILANQDRVPVLIFDEVDTGIGGQTIQSVAEKMSALARHHQLLCVTHSPQIASMADHHLLLYKEESNGRTVTRACSLEEQDRKKELARMLDGGLDPVNLKHVEAFLERAEKIKKDK